MCKVVVNRLMLGNRELGFELYSTKSGEVIEMTSNQIKTSLKSGKSDIMGLCLNEKGELVLDKENYYMENIMCKVHIGRLTPMVESETAMMNVFYYVTGTGEKDGDTLYHVISSRFARETMGHEKLMVLYQLGVLAGGAKVEGDKIISFDRKGKTEKGLVREKTSAKKEKGGV